ncbi:hypothetical protein CLV58_11371 [Spirosoma oryzae]|uniref:Uncharacterized protein n=1 Tax=Spirosoma oryzae TaxID=1469603 RepID=A0A2T0SRE5_9BACT|nr:hypothetical protein [Spirosoma oryzae]PRY35943.1 hypothetical protein CLV58_11371 [Spirosoma oryzae]
MIYQKMAFGLALVATLASFTSEATQRVTTNLSKSTARHLPQIKAVAPPMVTVPFTVIQRYFVKNTVKNAPANPRIDDRATFDKLFGAAAVMGTNGLPTSIDFANQSVIAVISPETNRATELLPVSLVKRADGKLVFSYRKKTGATQTYTTRPFLAVLIDKHVTGTVVLSEQR